MVHVLHLVHQDIHPELVAFHRRFSMYTTLDRVPEHTIWSHLQVRPDTYLSRSPRLIRDRARMVPRQHPHDYGNSNQRQDRIGIFMEEGHLSH